MDRTRQRHIDQARALGGLVLEGLGGRLLGALGIAVVVQHDPLAAACLVAIFARARQAVAAARARQTVVEKRAKRHRILQALRFMHGDDLHQVAIRFQAQLRMLAGIGRAALG